MNLPVLPYNQMSAGKMSAGAGVCVYVWRGTACDRLLDAISVCVCVFVCVCVCVGPSMRGAGVDGLLYHSLGCGLDSSLQDVGDCVMSV